MFLLNYLYTLFVFNLHTGLIDKDKKALENTNANV